MPGSPVFVERWSFSICVTTRIDDQSPSSKKIVDK